MKKIIINIVGVILDVFYRIYCKYRVERICSSFYSFGKRSNLNNS